MQNLVGQKLGHYHIFRQFGGGERSDLYLANDENPKRQVQVIVKVFKWEANLTTNQQERQRRASQFLHEAQPIVKLRHPHILALAEAGEEKGDLYVIMPYLPAGSLADFIANKFPKPRYELPISPEVTVQLVAQVAEALHHAHGLGITHGNLTPKNLLVHLAQPTIQGAATTANPSREATAQSITDQPRLLVADFDFPRSIPGGVAPKPSAYTAPEYYSHRVFPATDQYALACIVYLLLTGQEVFGGTPEELRYQQLDREPRPASHLNVRLSPDLDAVLARALAKSPERRYASIQEFAAAFRSMVESINSGRTRPIEEMVRPQPGTPPGNPPPITVRPPREGTASAATPPADQYPDDPRAPLPLHAYSYGERVGLILRQTFRNAAGTSLGKKVEKQFVVTRANISRRWPRQRRPTKRPPH